MDNLFEIGVASRQNPSHEECLACVGAKTLTPQKIGINEKYRDKSRPSRP